MSRIPVLLLSGVIALTGCGLGSVHPTLAESDVEFNKDLIGSWHARDGGDAAVIASSDDGAGYTVSYTQEGGKTGQFLALSGRIAGRRVLDLVPDADSASGNDSYKALLLPLHTVLFIDSVGSEVVFRGLEPDSISAILAREPSLVAHIKVEDRYVLTGSTAEVQKFIADVAARPGALQAPSVWVRRARF